jgi:O-antigen ligase
MGTRKQHSQVRQQSSFESKAEALPYILTGILAALAPWMLGGRAANALPLLGTIAWCIVATTLFLQVRKYRNWRIEAEYLRRRNQATSNPLSSFVRGLTAAVPLLLFIAILALSALNPAYERIGAVLTARDFHQFLPVVVDAARSRPALYLLAALVSLLICLSNPALRPSRRLLRAIAAGLLANAVLLTFIGLLTRYAGNGKILGVFEPKADYFYATFYYKNHWVAYGLIHCGIALMLIFRSKVSNPGDSRSRNNGQGALAAIGLICLALSMCSVESRSGVLLIFLFGIGSIIILQINHSSLRQKLILAVACLIGAGLFYAIIQDEIIENWERTERQISKTESIVFDQIRIKHGPKTCLEIFKDHPLYGCGYRSFSPLFSAYAPDEFKKDGRLVKRIEFAHNDWLQALAEFGSVGCSLLLIGIPLITWRRRRDVRKTSASGFSLAGPAPLYLALALLGLLATWDFPLSNPAVLINTVVLYIIAIRL